MWYRMVILIFIMSLLSGQCAPAPSRCAGLARPSYAWYLCTQGYAVLFSR